MVENEISVSWSDISKIFNEEIGKFNENEFYIKFKKIEESVKYTAKKLLSDVIFKFLCYRIFREMNLTN